jgi:hypothetical protein
VAALLTAVVVVVMTVRATRVDRPPEPVELVLLHDELPQVVAPLVAVPEH